MLRLLRWKVLVPIVAIAVGALGLASCTAPTGGTSLTITLVTDGAGYAASTPFPGGPIYCGFPTICQLNHSFGTLSPGELPGHITSCADINDGDTGRGARCAIIEGYDQTQYDGTIGTGALYDPTNYNIRIVNGHPQQVTADGAGGFAISTYPGDGFGPPCSGNGCRPYSPYSYTFEGCSKASSWDGTYDNTADDWRCDFESFDQIILDAPSGGFTMALSNMWPSIHADISDGACAFGVLGLTSGTVLGLKLLGASGCYEVLKPPNAGPGRAVKQKRSRRVLVG